MYVIALTGGIAAGKSTVSRRLREHGALVLDADQLARDVVEPGAPALDQVRDRFGPSVIADDGSLDRAALGAIVFNDAGARADLNAIVHPAIGRLLHGRLADIAIEQPDAVVIYDVPLLVESSRRDEDFYQHVIVVDAPAEVRAERLQSLRGMSPEESAGRIAAQATDEERRAFADTIIDSSGTLEHTLEQTDAFWNALTTRLATAG